MAKFKIKGLREYVQEIGRTVAFKAAENITEDLKTLGPYYSGEFEEGWIVKSGSVSIPANKSTSFTVREKWQGWEDGSFPFPRRITPVDIPRQSLGDHYIYTIGNEMDYRLYAMDLLPGRTPKPGNTAPQDWFVTYFKGSGLRNAIQKSTIEAKNDSAVKLFRP